MIDKKTTIVEIVMSFVILSILTALAVAYFKLYKKD